MLLPGPIVARDLAQGDAPSATDAQLAALAEILARPELRAGDGRSFLDAVLDPVRAWLRWLGWELLRWLDWLLAPVAEADGTVLLLAVVAVGLVVLVAVALAVRRLAGGALAGDAAAPARGGVSRLRAGEERTRARDLAAVGQRRRALHHLYRAVLLHLDEREHLAFDEALTNRELVPRLTAAPALAVPFGALVEQFDRLWYGQTGCSEEEYAQFAQLAEQVWRAAEVVAPRRGDRPAPGGGRHPNAAASTSGASGVLGGVP